MDTFRKNTVKKKLILQYINNYKTQIIVGSFLYHISGKSGRK